MSKPSDPKIKVSKPSDPLGNIVHLQAHEALHVKGPKPREGFVCPECDEAHPTAAAAWACAATHGVEENDKKCLWAGCGLLFARAKDSREHESVRAPATPARNGVPSRAAPRRAARALPTRPRRPSLGLPSHARPPAARRRCTRASGRTTAPRATRATSSRVRPPHRATPHAPPANQTPHRYRPPMAEWATLCCKVTGACKCGWTQKGRNGPRNFKAHKARCGRGAAPELLG